MKLNVKRSRPASTEDDDDQIDKALRTRESDGGGDDEGEEASNPSAWMIKGEAAQKRAEERSKIMSQRTPELWVKPGESRIIRFRSSEPVGIFEYSVPGPNDRFFKFTCPAEGEPDLFSSELGLRPSYVAIYEVFDVSGYVSKKSGKRIAYVPKFLKISGKWEEQLKNLRKDYGGKLTGRDMKYRRTGAGKDSVYVFTPLEKSSIPEQYQGQLFLMDEVAKYYAPLSEKSQRSVVRQAIRSAASRRAAD